LPPEGGKKPLLEFLKAYRDVVQLVIDEIWGLDKTPSKKRLYRMFYSKLRGLDFRAHHISEIYKCAKEVVEATKRSRGSKPVLRRLTARISTYDYKVDFNTKTLGVAVLNGCWVELTEVV